MAELHYALGLDIGISSVGWAALQNDFDGEPTRIQDLGVRIFDKAEQPKTGASLALPRREARSARRRLRRHHHRLERIRYLLEQANIMSARQIREMYSASGFAPTPGRSVGSVADERGNRSCADSSGTTARVPFQQHLRGR